MRTAFRPPLPSDPKQFATPLNGPSPSGVSVTFLGVATVFITDGTTSLLTDGFFSRPGIAGMLTRVRPNIGRIDRCLRRAGIESLDAVMVGHSHYDHSMDSGIVAARTGAVLIGSESTIQVGIGAGLAPNVLRQVSPAEPMTFGAFTVTMFESEHAPGAKFEGLITKPISTPAKINEYRMAQVYSMLIEHTGSDPSVTTPRRILVHGSAGFRPSMLTGHSADVAYLGVGTLGKQTDEHLAEYWDETVGATGAKLVVPIHWDDFTRSLDKPLVPFPYLADDFPRSLDYLHKRGTADGVAIRVQRAWDVVDPFGTL